MFQLPPRSEGRCLFRDVLKVKTQKHHVTAFELLHVCDHPTDFETDTAWREARKAVTGRRTQLTISEWEGGLDLIDRAYFLISTEHQRQTYRATCPDQNAPAAKRKLGLNEGTPADTTSMRRRRYRQQRKLCEQNGIQSVEAIDSHTNRKVVVRRLRSKYRSDVSKIQDLRSEARFLSTTSHPNLVEIYSVSLNRYCYVIEHLPYALTDRLSVDHDYRYAADEVREILRQSLQALGCLHDAGLIHGGLSRADFRMSEAGVVKLVTPPRVQSDSLPLPHHEQACVAPELLHPDEFGDLTPSTDFYMLGFMMYELLVGQSIRNAIPALSKVDDDRNTAFLWHSSESEELPSLKQLQPTLPEDLCQAIDLMCQKVPSQRPATAEKILAMLQAPQTKLPSVAPLGDRKNCESVPFSAWSKVNRIGDDVQAFLEDPGKAWEQLPVGKKAKAWAVITSLVIAFWIVGNPAVTRVDEPKAVAEDQWSGQESEMKIVEFGETVVEETSSDAGGPFPEAGAQQLAEAKLHDAKLHNAELPVSGPTSGEDQLAAMADKARLQNQISSAADHPQPPTSNDLHLVKKTTASDAIAVLELPNAPAFDPVKFSAVETATGQKLTHEEHLQLKQLMDEMERAQSHISQLKLRDQMIQLAPEDPRPHFAYWAARGFSDAAADSLNRAIDLTNEYNLPFVQTMRLQVESLLQSSFSTGYIGVDHAKLCRVIDQLLPRLNRIQLKVLEFSGKDRAEYFWIGTTYGYLQLASESHPGCQRAVENQRQHLISTLNSETEKAFSDGMKWSQQRSQPFSSASELFPRLYRHQIAICGQTIPLNADLSSPNRSLYVELKNR